jgi:hypothetical protein
MLPRLSAMLLVQEMHRRQLAKPAKPHQRSTVETQMVRHPLGLAALLRLGFVIAIGAGLVALAVWVRLSAALPHIDLI